MIWWIDTFRIFPGHYYRYAIDGENGMNNNAPISWRIPRIAGRPYAFRLRVV